MPKIGGKRKKTRTHKEIEEDEDVAGKIPKSFIFKRGKVPPPIKELIQDMREVMYPYTAIKFQESDKVKIKEYLKAASAYEISHFMIFTSTEKNNFVKFVKVPEGPTITFKILNYSTRKDVINSHLKPKNFSRNFSAPLLIMNDFNKKEADNNDFGPNSSNYSLISLMYQSLFAPLNVAKTHLNSLKRVVLLNLDQEKNFIYFRHYYILKSFGGKINKNIKKVLESKSVPDLSKFNDISDYILKNKQKIEDSEEESENEEDENKISENEDEQTPNKTSIKLYEIGPRLKLKLFKIEEGLLRGNVTYHSLIKKGEEELKEQKSKLKKKIKEKEERKKLQEKRIKEKTKEKKTKMQEEQEAQNHNKNEGDQILEEEIQEKPLKKVKKTKINLAEVSEFD